MKIGAAGHDQIVQPGVSHQIAGAFFVAAGVVRFHAVQQPLFGQLHHQLFVVIQQRMCEHRDPAGSPHQLQRVAGVGVFHRGLNAALFGEQLVVYLAVDGIGISRIHQRVHNMLLVHHRAAGGAFCYHFGGDGIIPHHLAHHFHRCLFAPFGHLAAQRLQPGGGICQIAQNVRFSIAGRVPGGKLHPLDHPHALPPPDHSGAHRRSGGIMIGDRQRRQIASPRQRNHLLNTHRTVR